MSDTLPQEQRQSILARSRALEQQLEQPTLGAVQREELGRKWVALQEVVQAIHALQGLETELEGVRSVLTDPQIDAELRALAETEQESLRERQQGLQRRIRLMLLSSDARDDSPAVILEVRSGTGGIEAGLFAADLLRMYARYADMQRWRVEVIDLNEDHNGSMKQAVAIVHGKDVFRRLKFESGVHRVQRVPVTEASGRIHTSAASVVVLAKPREIHVQIPEKSLRIDTYRASGAGGQHVNKTDSAVRITHLPTGIVVQCQDEKSQHRNRDKAMQVLLARVYDFENQKQAQERSQTRRAMIGSGDRSERIRTYNFPQGRVTDHRIGLTLHKLDRILSGEDLDELIDALVTADEARRLSESHQADDLS